MNVRITKAVSLQSATITVGDLRSLLEAAEEVGAQDSTKVAIREQPGDQRDPGYVTITIDGGRTA